MLQLGQHAGRGGGAGFSAAARGAATARTTGTVNRAVSSAEASFVDVETGVRKPATDGTGAGTDTTVALSGTVVVTGTAAGTGALVAVVGVVRLRAADGGLTAAAESTPPRRAPADGAAGLPDDAGAASRFTRPAVDFPAVPASCADAVLVSCCVGVSAQASPVPPVTAAPTPSATAKAPMRPTFVAAIFGEFMPNSLWLTAVGPISAKPDRQQTVDGLTELYSLSGSYYQRQQS